MSSSPNFPGPRHALPSAIHAIQETIPEAIPALCKRGGPWARSTLDDDAVTLRCPSDSCRPPCDSWFPIDCGLMRLGWPLANIVHAGDGGHVVGADGSELNFSQDAAPQGIEYDRMVTSCSWRRSVCPRDIASPDSPSGRGQGPPSGDSCHFPEICATWLASVIFFSAATGGLYASQGSPSRTWHGDERDRGGRTDVMYQARKQPLPGLSTPDQVPIGAIA
ncbi:hypothetical protein GE09DRAFT_230 [Coniochaeta sp. 2T2.1]|nr:hypothetical protein GE09DRAFT_230 [Coniochaeta sp. 2T2.1]